MRNGHVPSAATSRWRVAMRQTVSAGRHRDRGRETQTLGGVQPNHLPPAADHRRVRRAPSATNQRLDNVASLTAVVGPLSIGPTVETCRRQCVSGQSMQYRPLANLPYQTITYRPDPTQANHHLPNLT